MRRQSGRSDAGFGVRDELFVLVVVGRNVLLYLFALALTLAFPPPPPPFPGWVSRCLTFFWLGRYRSEFRWWQESQRGL